MGAFGSPAQRERQEFGEERGEGGYGSDSGQVRRCLSWGVRVECSNFKFQLGVMVKSNDEFEEENKGMYKK